MQFQFAPGFLAIDRGPRIDARAVRVHYRHTLRRTSECNPKEILHAGSDLRHVCNGVLRVGEMVEFPRIKRLPPYVFNITGELKMAARRRGEDIIDMSMGNPDGPTPQHIVDKLVEAAQRQDTHGYSVSKGIPRLRLAICNWYRRRYGIDLDPDKEAIVTIGSKEGIAHLALCFIDRASFERWCDDDAVRFEDPRLHQRLKRDGEALWQIEA